MHDFLPCIALTIKAGRNYGFTHCVLSNSTHATETRPNAYAFLTPCAFCEDLLDREDLYECHTCGLLYCARTHEGKPDCQCRCGIPTPEKAVAAAQAFLLDNELLVQSTETMIIEDESATFFGISGPTEWLRSTPIYEDLYDHCLPIEFAMTHLKDQEIALDCGQAGYLTPSFAVAIKRFDIDRRVFTVSVFHPFA